MHWLILLPYYFVGTLTLLPSLMILCRLIRLKLAINTLVASAIALSIGGIIVPLVCDWIDLSAFSARPMLVLILLSLLFAATDAALSAHLPLPLDKDLQEL
ncbi:MAG: hypothetical protein ACE5I7_09570 [Candidatus Binatia bacterium]